METLGKICEIIYIGIFCLVVAVLAGVMVYCIVAGCVYDAEMKELHRTDVITEETHDIAATVIRVEKNRSRYSVEYSTVLETADGQSMELSITDEQYVKLREGEMVILHTHITHHSNFDDKVSYEIVIPEKQ